MTLPEPILSFWNASLRLHERTLETSWGVVVTDPRYPRVYEANHASVLRHMPGLTVGEIRAELIPALDQAGATHEHIELMDAGDDCPALRDLMASPGEHDPHVVMVYGEDGPIRKAVPEVAKGVEVEEVLDPDESFWELIRAVPNQYGDPLPDEVLDQMVDRVRDLFVPNGQRFFLGAANGTDAGVASVVTLEGVAYIDNVVTWPEHRGRGVATAMVGAAVRASVEAGAEVVFLLAEEGGAAQRLYERLGFRVRRRCFGFTRPLHDRSPAR